MKATQFKLTAAVTVFGVLLSACSGGGTPSSAANSRNINPATPSTSSPSSSIPSIGSGSGSSSVGATEADVEVNAKLDEILAESKKSTAAANAAKDSADDAATMATVGVALGSLAALAAIGTIAEHVDTGIRTGDALAGFTNNKNGLISDQSANKSYAKLSPEVDAATAAALDAGDEAAAQGEDTREALDKKVKFLEAELKAMKEANSNNFGAVVENDDKHAKNAGEDRDAKAKKAKEDAEALAKKAKEEADARANLTNGKLDAQTGMLAKALLLQKDVNAIKDSVSALSQKQTLDNTARANEIASLESSLKTQGALIIEMTTTLTALEASTTSLTKEQNEVLKPAIEETKTTLKTVKAQYESAMSILDSTKAELNAKIEAAKAQIQASNAKQKVEAPGVESPKPETAATPSEKSPESDTGPAEDFFPGFEYHF